MSKANRSRVVVALALVAVAGALAYACGARMRPAAAGDAASKVYVAPGSLDKFYAFLSGGRARNSSRRSNIARCRRPDRSGGRR